jgi:LPS O-antigen subunit length determinant protein (WzzB/FepE family)
MGGLGNEKYISPNLYPLIVKSSPFLEELSNFKIKVKDFDERILLGDFLYNYSKLSFMDIYKKDLLGRKIEILNKINIKKDDDKLNLLNVKYSSFSNADKLLYDFISEKISINYITREGILRIQATMPDPISAAELAQKTTDLLQKKIIEFKVKKAREELIFLEKRYLETQQKFNEKKMDFAEFQDKNLNLISSRSNIKFNQLQSEYDLISNVFLQIAQQLESQKLKVKKETPIFSVIEPVTVPLIRSSPIRTKILKIWLLSGIIFGIIIVLANYALLYLKLIFKK